MAEKGYREEQLNLKINVLSGNIYNQLSSHNYILSNQFYIIDNKTSSDISVMLGNRLIGKTYETEFNTILTKLDSELNRLDTII